MLVVVLCKCLVDVIVSCFVLNTCNLAYYCLSVCMCLVIEQISYHLFFAATDKCCLMEGWNKGQVLSSKASNKIITKHLVIIDYN